jgi:hypothetical protein
LCQNQPRCGIRNLGAVFGDLGAVFATSVRYSVVRYSVRYSQPRCGIRCRVFNPTLQSRKFDPDGAYLRAYLPERRDDDRKAVHLPRKPIVDHAKQKAKALAMYKKGAGMKK